MNTELQKLQEASLSRVWQHFNDKNTTAVILTGFRGDKSYEENVRRNKKIAAELRNAGFGYFFVDGYWIENQGTPEEIKVKEDSIFAVTKDPNKSKELIELAHSLANKYNQDAILVKEKTDVYLLNKDGSKDNLSGSLKPGKMGDFYTQLRNNKKANAFVFESERDALGYFGSFKEYLSIK